jgi:hypothetical protein
MADTVLMWQQYVRKYQAISEGIYLQIRLESDKVMDFMVTYKCFWVTMFCGRSIVNV